MSKELRRGGEFGRQERMFREWAEAMARESMVL